MLVNGGIFFDRMWTHAQRVCPNFFPVAKQDMPSLPPTYVISMDDTRLERVLGDLPPVEVVHIQGVRGCEHRHDPRLTRFGKMFCTDRMIGCALAHNDAAKRVVDDAHAFALILEDDVFVVEDMQGLADRIDAVVHEHGAQAWDIITLFCQGVCSNHSRIWNGSTAAYLLSAKGARTLVQMRIGYHEDYLRNSLALHTIVGPNLFSTRDDRSIVPFANQSLGFWSKQDIIRLGVWDMTVVQALVLWSVACAAAKMCRNGALLSTLLVVPIVFTVFMSYETQYYRCSGITRVMNLVFPAFVLIAQQHPSQINRNASTVMAQGMIVFQLLHEFDRR